MRTVTGLLALALVSGLALADDNWPRFRGPNGAGVSDATTVPVQWTGKDYNWKVKLPGVGHGSPVVWGKRIFLLSADPQTATRTVLCLDTATGNTLWKREFASKTFHQNNDNSYASSTPAADADGVIVTWTAPDEVTLLALDLEGKDVWRRNLGPYVALHGGGVSPILCGGAVILPNDQEDPSLLPFIGAFKKAGKSSLIAVDRKTGEDRWRIERKTALAAYSVPCVNQVEGGPPELIFTSTGQGMTAVDLATGKVNWEVPGIFTNRCVGSPVVGSGLVMASYGVGGDGTLLYAVRPGSKEKGVEPAIVYQVKKPPLVPTPLVKDGRLFLWSDDGSVSCLKAESGETIWREKVGGSYYGSPVCVNNRLYCIAKNGDVVVLAAADKYELLGRAALGEPSFATPAVAGGVMYLRTQSQLFSLGGKRE